MHPARNRAKQVSYVLVLNIILGLKEGKDQNTAKDMVGQEGGEGTNSASLLGRKEEIAICWHLPLIALELKKRFGGGGGCMCWLRDYQREALIPC